MIKKLLVLFVFLLNTFCIFAQNKEDEHLIKFIKGNISDKTTAVREASGSQSIILAMKAIDFSLENKEILGQDRELEGLAVAAIFSISPDYIKNANEAQKKIIVSQFIKLFKKFQTSSTVAITTLTKYSSLYQYLQDEEFVKVLNDYLKTQEFTKSDESIYKSILSTLQLAGNSESFLVLYELYNDSKYSVLSEDLEKTLVVLSSKTLNEIFALLETSEVSDLTKIFNLCKKNENFSKKTMCDISEKVILKSILLLGSSSAVSQEDVSVQFETVIKCLSDIAPVDAILPLTTYLEELNRQKEDGREISSVIILSVINTLGAIGDKSAFDSLLAVTYLNYDESILSAARKALSGLRW